MAKLDTVIQIRMLPADKAILKREAALRRRSLSDWARSTLMGYVSWHEDPEARERSVSLESEIAKWPARFKDPILMDD